MLSTPNLIANRIPDRASALVDIRFPPPHSAHEMDERVCDIVGPRCEVVRLIAAEPTHLSPDPLYVRITSEVTGRRARLTRESGGSDARFVCVYGTPVLMSRPVVGNLHAEDEWIDVGSMLTFYDIYERFLAEKLGVAGP
jgi:succinyl-diaminopimelate desuccinylase